MAPAQKKRNCITIEEKIKLIEEVDKGAKTRAAICRDHGIPSGSLYTILKDKDKIMSILESGNPRRKRNRKTAYDDLDQALKAWFMQAKGLNLPLSGPILIEKGESLARQLGYSDFKMSCGWLDRFKLRYGISFNKGNSGDSLSVKTESFDTWEEELQATLAQYNPRDIFSADETGLLYNVLPRELYHGERASESQTSKEKISLLVGANMDGSEKLPLLAIGNIQKPKSFTKIKTLPVTYKWNSQSWMTPKIFKEWINELDLMFHTQDRTIALIVDACGAHSRLPDLKAVKLILVPSNALLSKAPPCKQGIIKSLKMHYRKRVLQKYIARVEETGPDSKLQISLLNAITMVSAAWNDVTSQTVANSFRLAGFSPEDSKIPSVPQASPEMSEIKDLFKKLADLVPLQSRIDIYITNDDDIQTSEQPAMTLDEIAISDTGKDELDSEVTITPAAAFNALETMRLFFMQHEHTDAALTQLNSLESLLNRTVQQS